MGRKTLRIEYLRDVVRGGLVTACGALMLAGATGDGSGQTSAKRFLIGNGAIVTALQRNQVPVSGIQIRLSAPMTSSIAQPELAIRSLTMEDKHSAHLLVECRNSAECLPFYVSVSWPVDIDVASFRGSFVHGTEIPSEVAIQATPESLTSLRAGSPAMLLLDGERVHVMLRVVCLESGDPGDKVRVATPDRRQQYVANVIAPGVLKGTF